MKTFFALFVVIFVAQANCEKLVGLPVLKDVEVGWKAIADHAESLASSFQKQKLAFEIIKDAVEGILRASEIQHSSQVEEFRSQLISFKPKCREEAEKSLQLALKDSSVPSLSPCVSLGLHDLAAIGRDIVEMGFEVFRTTVKITDEVLQCVEDSGLNFQSFENCLSNSFPSMEDILKEDEQKVVEVGNAIVKLANDLLGPTCFQLENKLLTQKGQSVLREASDCSRKI